MAFLEVKDLHVKVEDKEILKGVSLTVDKGEVVALMGPNGSGKSTLAYALMGHPRYEITSGKILLNGEDATEMPADERAKKGLFLTKKYDIIPLIFSLTSFVLYKTKMARLSRFKKRGRGVVNV